MRGVIKNFLWFVIKTVFIVFAALLAVKVPEIFVANFGYMIKSDMGYVWVINFVIAFVVAWIIPKKIIDAESSRGIYYVITVGTFIVVTILCESVIWHPREIGTIIARGITLERVICVGIGILASAATSFIERKKKSANSAQHSAKGGRYSAPKAKNN